MKYNNNLFIFVITVVVLITVVVHGAPGRGSFGGRGGFGGSRGGGSRGSSSRGSGSGSKSSGGWFGGWFSSSKSSSATASHPVASAPSHSSVNSVSNTRPIGWQLNNGQHVTAPKSVSKLDSGISKPVASAPSLASVNEHQMIGGKSAGSAPIGWNVPNSKPVGPPPAYPGLEKMPVGTMHNSPPAYSPSLDKMPPAYSSINHLSPGASSGSHLGPPAYSPSLDKMPPPYSSINHMSPGASSGSHLGPPAYSAVPVSGGMAAQPPIAVVNNYPVASHGSSFGSSWGTHALAFQLGAMNSHSHSSHIHHYYHGSSTTSTTTPSPAVAPAVELSSVATPLAPYPFVYFDHNGLVVIPTSSNVTTPASNATSEIKATNMTEVTSESTVNPPNVTNEMKATNITKVTSGSTVNPPNVISEATAKPPKVTREIPMMSTTESLSINLDNQPLIEASKLYHVSSIPMTTTTELPAPVESSTTSTYDSWNSYLAKIIVDILYRTASKKAINIETTTVMDPKTNDLTP